MNADELFEMSKKNNTWHGKHEVGLPIRILNALPIEYFLWDENEHRYLKDAPINWSKLKEDVESGEIWNIRLLGEKSVRQICEVLSERENGSK